MAAALANAAALVARAVSQRKQPVVWSVVGLAVGIVVGGLWVSGFGDAGSLDEARRPTQFSITPEELARLTGTQIALSPDGRRLVYPARGAGARQLYLRGMNDLEAKPIAGTETGRQPFFSPDGKWLGFYSLTEDGVAKLKKVSLTEGQVVTLSDLNGVGNERSESAPRGFSWGPNGTIVFARAFMGLWEVSAEGGTPRALTALDPSKFELGHIHPHFLPGGEAIPLCQHRVRRFVPQKILSLEGEMTRTRC